MEFGLLGKKLSHSYSPLIHSFYGNYSYELVELAESEVERFLTDKNFRGINVTIPYKEAVIPYLDTISDSAEKIGSVNTIIKDEQGLLHGYNTDQYGFMTLLKSTNADVKNKKCLILGSGGSAKTVHYVLEKAGAKQIVIISRNGENTYSNLEKNKDADIIVNTTPVGMFPNTGISPVDLIKFPRVKCVIDIIYNPCETALIKQAKKLNIKYANGLLMLAAQAKPAAELFLNRKIDDNTVITVKDKVAEIMKKKIKIINGPNLNMLGIREPEIYGSKTYADLCEFINQKADELGTYVDIFQSNSEGEIVTEIQNCYGKFDAIIINPAAYTHTSIAILDALKSVGLPAVEVHLSDVSSREAFRQVSYAGMACTKTFMGQGFDGYLNAMLFILSN